MASRLSVGGFFNGLLAGSRQTPSEGKMLNVGGNIGLLAGNRTWI